MCAMIRTKILNLVWRWLVWASQKEELTKLTDRQKMIAYKDAFAIENFRELLKARKKVHIIKAALQSPTNMEHWFERGQTAAYKELDTILERYHKLWIAEQQSKNKK